MLDFRPASLKTDFHRLAGRESLSRSGMAVDPAVAARNLVHTIERGRDFVYPHGMFARIMEIMNRLLPRRLLVLWLGKKSSQAGYLALSHSVVRKIDMERVPGDDRLNLPPKMTCANPTFTEGPMRKSIDPLTPSQVYRYAVQAFQPHLKLRGAKKAPAQTILTVLFAAAARISSLSDTCRRLRDVPDEHAVADALYSTLPEYNILRHVSKPRCAASAQGLRRRPQVVALDLTLLPYYGADAKTNPLVVRSKAKKGTCSFYGYGTAYVVHKGYATPLR